MYYYEAFKAFLLFLLIIIVVGLLLMGMARYVPNPWIRYSIDVSGKGYYLDCLDITPNNAYRADFPNIGDWCNND